MKRKDDTAVFFLRTLPAIRALENSTKKKYKKIILQLMYITKCRGFA